MPFLLSPVSHVAVGTRDQRGDGRVDKIYAFNPIISPNGEVIFGPPPNCFYMVSSVVLIDFCTGAGLLARVIEERMVSG